MEAAWLIRWTWDEAGEAKRSPVLGIHPLERTPQEIRRIVEALYAALHYDAEGLLAAAEDPWAAPSLSRIERHPGRGPSIVCGSSPRIQADEVRNLALVSGPVGPLLQWQERDEDGRWVQRSVAAGDDLEPVRTAV